MYLHKLLKILFYTINTSIYAMEAEEEIINIKNKKAVKQLLDKLESEEAKTTIQECTLEENCDIDVVSMLLIDLINITNPKDHKIINIFANSFQRAVSLNNVFNKDISPSAAEKDDQDIQYDDGSLQYINDIQGSKIKNNFYSMKKEIENLRTILINEKNPLDNYEKEHQDIKNNNNLLSLFSIKDLEKADIDSDDDTSRQLEDIEGLVMGDDINISSKDLEECINIIQEINPEQKKYIAETLEYTEEEYEDCYVLKKIDKNKEFLGLNEKIKQLENNILKINNATTRGELNRQCNLLYENIGNKAQSEENIERLNQIINKTIAHQQKEYEIKQSALMEEEDNELDQMKQKLEKDISQIADKATQKELKTGLDRLFANSISDTDAQNNAQKVIQDLCEKIDKHSNNREVAEILDKFRITYKQYHAMEYQHYLDNFTQTIMPLKNYVEQITDQKTKNELKNKLNLLLNVDSTTEEVKDLFNKIAECNTKDKMSNITEHFKNASEQYNLLQKLK